MSVKRVLLTEAQFAHIHASGWHIDEIERDDWEKIPGLQRLQDTFAIMCSGCITSPLVLNKINAIAGIDVLVHEPHPKPNEREGNAYHYVIQKINDERYPYILHGPFRSETIVDHWFDAPDLDLYWQDTTD